jgi:glyoxylase-like metal-dependent hydrolase (beta-lactamase superfamily II)
VPVKKIINNQTKSTMKKLLFILLTGVIINVSMSAQKVFKTTTGKFQVALLSEGDQKGNKSILIGAGEEMMRVTIPDGYFQNAVNAFLVQTGEHNMLIDTGFGRFLFDNLREVGIDSAAIDIVLITHAHGDHIGGMLRNGKPCFENATVYIAQQEYDYWIKSGNKTFAAIVEVYGKRIKTFKPNGLNDAAKTPLVAGIIPVAAFGHTPGHTAYLIESENERLLVWGDLTHAMAIQIPFPEVAVTYDVDPEQAIKTRIEILKYVFSNKIPVAGMHIAYPAIGKIEKTKKKEMPKNAYDFVPLQK